MIQIFGAESVALASIETLLINTTLKASVVLGIVAIITLLMWRASAASRHSVWVLGVCVVVLVRFL